MSQILSSYSSTDSSSNQKYQPQQNEFINSIDLGTKRNSSEKSLSILNSNQFEYENMYQNDDDNPDFHDDDHGDEEKSGDNHVKINKSEERVKFDAMPTNLQFISSSPSSNSSSVSEANVINLRTRKSEHPSSGRLNNNLNLEKLLDNVENLDIKKKEKKVENLIDIISEDETLSYPIAVQPLSTPINNISWPQLADPQPSANDFFNKDKQSNKVKSMAVFFDQATNFESSFKNTTAKNTPIKQNSKTESNSSNNFHMKYHPILKATSSETSTSHQEILNEFDPISSAEAKIPSKNTETDSIIDKNSESSLKSYNRSGLLPPPPPSSSSFLPRSNSPINPFAATQAPSINYATFKQSNMQRVDSAPNPLSNRIHQPILPHSATSNLPMNHQQYQTVNMYAPTPFYGNANVPNVYRPVQFSFMANNNNNINNNNSILNHMINNNTSNTTLNNLYKPNQ